MAIPGTGASRHFPGGDLTMGSSAVRMTLRWHVPLARSRSVAQALHSLMVAARSEPGFVSSSMSADVANQAGVQYCEEWARSEERRVGKECRL